MLFRGIRTDLRSNARIAIVCSCGILILANFLMVAPPRFRHDSNHIIVQPKTGHWMGFAAVALLRLALAILAAAVTLTILPKLD